MKNILFGFAALVLVASASAEHIIRIPIGGGFPAVNLVEGQSVRVVLSNVLAPKPGSELRACPVQIEMRPPDRGPFHFRCPR
jgi:hypothetical protein